MRKLDLIAGGLVLTLGGLLAGVLLTGGGSASAQEPLTTTTTASSDGAGDHGTSGRHFSFGLGLFQAELEDVLGLPIDEVRQRIADGEALSDLAEAQGVDVVDVLDVLTNGLATHLEEAVDSGDMTRADADGVLERIQTTFERLLGGDLDVPLPEFDGHFEFFFGDGGLFGHDETPFLDIEPREFFDDFGSHFDFPAHEFPFDFGPSGPSTFALPGVSPLGVIDAVADVLDLTVPELFEQLASGQSLGQIADERSVDRGAVRELLLRPVDEWLTDAQADGFLSPEQAREVRQGAAALADAVIDHAGIGRFGFDGLSGFGSFSFGRG